jgi:hypothetical protein
MDSKYVRKTVENLLAELERNPAIGRRQSPSFMSRYGRPLGLGIALGVSGVAGCDDSDALPPRADAYGGGPFLKRDASPPTSDASDAGALDLAADTRDALPNDVPVYGVGIGNEDAQDATPKADTRDAVPEADAVYGTDVGYGIDTKDAPPIADTGDASSRDGD